MKQCIPLFGLGLVALSACQPETTWQTWEAPSAIRTLDVLAEEHIRFAAAEGWVGQTLNQGETWTRTQWMAPDSTTPSFRSSASNGTHWFAASIASPAWIAQTPLRSLDPTWVHHDTSATVFLDAMAWWNADEGLVFGDPVDGCLTLLETRDAGQSWQRLSCDDVPKHTTGEAGFAASNGNICIQGDTAWVFTGGIASRCLRTVDRGHHWEAIGLPIRQGESMTGVFGASFANAQEGVAIGGHWEHPDDNVGNLIASSDGGKTWTPISDGAGPGYRSCIQHHPKRSQEIVAVGFKGMDVSLDGGQTWKHVNDTSAYVARFAPEGRILWLAGKDRIHRVDWDNLTSEL
ncbi:MAG: WD40/YVTN/BNR-like repeat-containing protein [Flavobacteriales bacterium]